MQTPAGTVIRDPDRPCPAPQFSRWAGEYLREARRTGGNGENQYAFLTAFTVFLALLFTLILPFSSGARAEQGILANDDLVVTGFSGTKDLGGQTFINTDGASLKVRDVSGRGAPRGQLVDAPVKFEAFARDIGQVFGVALDNAPNPNIYATSTAVHGLQIVIPDNNGDGVPERVQTGQPGASFMEGQFGAALGGGPGTVWKIDGTTGEISKFADITNGGVENSGPGLGNITFDPVHYQFYVSDLDTGLIHRLDLSGNDLGTFDHGVDGRPGGGLGPVGQNPANRMDITNAAFDSTNPATWGLTVDQRLVWGMVYFDGRLYYSDKEGPRIWSVGINADGSFAGDARIEIEQVPGKAISDMLVTPGRKLVVSDRGGILGSHDYTQYHTPADNRVLRYSRDETGKWIQEPDEYAIGLPANHRWASGGVGLACDGTLWSTGDNLRNDPALGLGAPFVVHGLQGNHVSRVIPANVPPRVSHFIDHDGQFADPEKAGHVGDVEVVRDCKSGHSGWYPIPEWTPPHGWVPPVWWPREPDLDIEKHAIKCVKHPAAIAGLFYRCTYTIFVTNHGAADWVGNLNVVDNPPASAVFVPPPGGSIPWTCNQPGGAGTAINCVSDNVETLHPGETETLEITIDVNGAEVGDYIRNCVTVEDPFDYWPNEDCDETEHPRPDIDIEKRFDFCIPEGGGWRCFFTIWFQNLGGVDYHGPLSFDENFPAGTIFGGIDFSTTAGWGCVGGNPTTCTLPNPPGVHMGPGDVELVGISVIIPAGMHGDYENCVNLGNAHHAGDPVAPGKNEHCEPFSVPSPIKHECPAGWQEVPPGGAPIGWTVVAIDGINPDGSKWGMMCMRPKPQEKADNKQPQPEHNCPAGWQKAPNGVTPAGYDVIIIDGINPDGSKWGIKCMRPKLKQPEGPRCATGERQVANPSLLPSNWKVRKETRNGKTIWCARPIRVIPDPVKPRCNRDEKTFIDPSRIPSTWTKRLVRKGKFAIWCAKPGRITPDPVGPKCPAGQRQVPTPSAAPKGWTVTPLTRNGKTIFCAKPGSVTNPGGGQTTVPPRPSCKGGKLVLLKSLPPRWSCICPQRQKLVNGVCLPDYPQSTPEITPCPKGWSRVRGKCVPPVICQKGWRKVNGRCLPPVIKQPKPVICQKGWRKVNGRCLPPIIKKPTVKPCPRGWKRIKGRCTPPVIKKPTVKKPTIKIPQTRTPLIKKPTIRKKPQTINRSSVKRLNAKVIKPSKTLRLKAPSRKFR